MGPLRQNYTVITTEHTLAGLPNSDIDKLITHPAEDNRHVNRKMSALMNVNVFSVNLHTHQLNCQRAGRRNVHRPSTGSARRPPWSAGGASWRFPAAELDLRPPCGCSQNQKKKQRELTSLSGIKLLYIDSPVDLCCLF